MRSACDIGRRLGLDTQLQGAQVACQLVLLTRRDHGGHSRANGLLAAEAGFGEQLAHLDDVGKALQARLLGEGRGGHGAHRDAGHIRNARHKRAVDDDQTAGLHAMLELVE